MTNINIGTGANTGTGDNLRDAFIIVNNNFDETQASLDDKLDNTDLVEINNSINNKANLVHTHTISQVVGLTASLASKADTTSLNDFISSVNNSISTINSTKLDDAPNDGKIYGRKDNTWVQAGSNVLVYTALISQESTNAPTAIVLENTTGLDIKFSYVNEGEYLIYNADNLELFTENKTFVLYTEYDTKNYTGTTPARFRWQNSKEILIFTQDNDLLRNACLEIKIYS